MNKILNFFVTNFLVMVFFIIIALIIFPLPKKFIEALFAFNFTFAFYLFLLTHLSHSVSYTRFSRSVFMFCLFICASAVSTTRTFLSITDFNEQLYIFKIIGNWLCRETYTAGFCSTVLICLLVFKFCVVFLDFISNKASKRHRDEESVFQKEINSKLENKEITQVEAFELQVKYNNSHYYFGEKEVVGHYLKGTILAFLVLYIIAIGGGVTLGILELNMYWEDALYQYVILASGYIVLFTIPLFIATLSFRSSILY